MNVEPLPCPFCGATGLDFSSGFTFRRLIYACQGCGIGSETRIQTMGKGTPAQWLAQAELDAIKEWNKRTPPAASGNPHGARGPDEQNP